jgi:hypothetical protein
MRSVRSAVVVSLFALAVPLCAQDVRLAESGRTVAQLMGHVKEHIMLRRINVITGDFESNPFIIPVAGSAAGANGTFFKSDVTLVNHDLMPRALVIAYFARGVNNGSAMTFIYNIAADSVVTEEDFVGRLLGKSGIGALLITALDSNGDIDNFASIDGFSRIWTKQPGSTGTVSQEFTAIDVNDNLVTSYGYGLRQDEGYRTNIGAVNIFDTPNTFFVEVHGTRGSNTLTIPVQAYSMDQVSAGPGIYGNFWIKVDSAGDNFNWWSAYGSSVDNTTGDGWVSHVH